MPQFLSEIERVERERKVAEVLQIEGEAANEF